MLFGKRIVTTISVDGMHCGHCAARVSASLKTLQGVRKADVNLDAKEVRLVSSKELKEEEMKSAIETAGFVYLGVKGK